MGLDLVPFSRKGSKGDPNYHSKFDSNAQTVDEEKTLKPRSLSHVAIVPTHAARIRRTCRTQYCEVIGANRVCLPG